MMIYADRLRFWIDFVKVIKKVESTILSINKKVLWVKRGLKSLGEILFMIKISFFEISTAFLKSRLK